MREGSLAAQPVGVVTGAGQQLTSDLDADTGQREQAGRGRGDQGAQLGVGLGDLLVQVLVAAGKAAQRCLGGLLRVTELTGRAQPGAGRGQCRGAQLTQLLTQLCGGGDQQRLELVGALGMGFDRATACDPRRPDRLDPNVGGS